MKKFAKIIKNYFFIFWHKPSLLIIALMAGAMYGLIDISKPLVDFSVLSDVSIWISSFIMTFLIYMITSTLFERISFFKKNQAIKNVLIFVLTTVITESIKYKVEQYEWYYYIIKALIGFSIGFVLVMISIALGSHRGLDKADKEYEKELKESEEFLHSLPNTELYKMKKDLNYLLRHKDIVYLCKLIDNEEAINLLIKDISEEQHRRK